MSENSRNKFKLNAIRLIGWILLMCIPLTYSICITKKPTIFFFTSDKSVVHAGDEITLSWHIKDSDLIYIEEIGFFGYPEHATVLLNYSVTTIVEKTTYYLLVARNKDEIALSELTVTVIPRITPEIVEFKAVPRRIDLGADAELSWNVKDAMQIFIHPDIGEVTSQGNPMTGTRKVSPQKTTIYRLTATNGEQSTLKSTTVTIKQSANVIMTNGPNWREDDFSFSYYGTVKNVGNNSARNVKITIHLYDDAGKFIDSGESFADLINLDPGQKSSWDVKFSDIDKLIRKEVNRSKTQYEIDFSQ